MDMDDSTVKLKQGDILVQRGTNHAWANRSGRNARVAFVLVDAKPLGIGKPVLELLVRGVGAAGADGAGAPLPEPGSAVFASPVQMGHDYRASKSARQEARRKRRVQRKLDRGQPQRLRDIEFS